MIYEKMVQKEGGFYLSRGFLIRTCGSLLHTWAKVYEVFRVPFDTLLYRQSSVRLNHHIEIPIAMISIRSLDIVTIKKKFLTIRDMLAFKLVDLMRRANAPPSTRRFFVFKVRRGDMG